jgi:hypothetical protein
MTDCSYHATGPHHISVTVVSRDVVHRTARVMGPASAAAQALTEAETVHRGAAEVCKPAGSDTLLVIPHADLVAAGWAPDNS